MDESELIEKLKNGDEEASRYFVVIFQKPVWLHARRLSGNPDHADDITQDVFLKAFETIHSFRQQSSLNTWLHRITVNRFLMEQRKQSISKMSQNDNSVDGEELGYQTMAVDHSESENHSGNHLLKNRLNKIISGLAEGQRQVFELRYQDGLTMDEIANVMGIANGTVKSHLYRAIEKIRRELNVKPDQINAKK